MELLDLRTASESNKRCKVRLMSLAYVINQDRSHDYSPKCGSVTRSHSRAVSLPQLKKNKAYRYSAVINGRLLTREHVLTWDLCGPLWTGTASALLVARGVGVYQNLLASEIPCALTLPYATMP